MSKEEETLKNRVPISGIFENFKGNRYKVLLIARSSEDRQLYVCYQALYNSAEFGDQAVWVRSLKTFVENVAVDGKEVPRFRLITEKP
jgi:hypothetical protein